MEARSIFIDFPYVNHIPVVDEKKRPIGIITKQDAFWKRYYEEGFWMFQNWSCRWKCRSKEGVDYGAEGAC